MSKVFSRLRSRGGQLRTFRVTLKIHLLNSIPTTPTLVFVKWKVDDQAGGRHEGFTKPKPIEKGNVVRWDQTFEFVVRIPSDPVHTVLLQPCVLRFSVRKMGTGKKRKDEKVGVVELDLSELAGIGKVEKNALLHECTLNATLKLTLRLTQEKGDEIFQRPIKRRSMSMAGMSSLGLGFGVGASNVSAQKAASVADVKTIPPVPGKMKKLRKTASFRARRTMSMNDAALTAANPELKHKLGLRSVDDISLEHPADKRKVSGTFVELVPEDAQRAQFEKIFDARLRDTYPDYVIESRVDAAEVIDSLFAEDSQVELPLYSTTKSSNSDTSDKTNELNLESLLESRWTYVTKAAQESRAMRHV